MKPSVAPFPSELQIAPTTVLSEPVRSDVSQSDG